MSHRPDYPTATILERAAHAVLAAATGIGLMVAVVAAFQSQLPAPLAGQSLASRAACERPASVQAACPASIPSAVVASR